MIIKYLILYKCAEIIITCTDINIIHELQQKFEERLFIIFVLLKKNGD